MEKVYCPKCRDTLRLDRRHENGKRFFCIACDLKWEIAMISTGIEVDTRQLRDPYTLLLALVECMSTFNDTDPAAIERTQAALVEYERSGDHNHGRGPIAPSGKCDGGDCWVGKVRAELAALKKVK